jgi:hypothetical protein
VERRKTDQEIERTKGKETWSDNGWRAKKRTNVDPAPAIIVISGRVHGGLDVNDLSSAMMVRIPESMRTTTSSSSASDGYEPGQPSQLQCLPCRRRRRCSPQSS